MCRKKRLTPLLCKAVWTKHFSPNLTQRHWFKTYVAVCIRLTRIGPVLASVARNTSIQNRVMEHDVPGLWQPTKPQVVVWPMAHGVKWCMFYTINHQRPRATKPGMDHSTHRDAKMACDTMIWNTVYAATSVTDNKVNVPFRHLQNHD